MWDFFRGSVCRPAPFCDMTDDLVPYLYKHETIIITGEEFTLTLHTA